MKLLIAAGAVILLLSGCPSVPQVGRGTARTTAADKPGVTVSHAASGMQFPFAVGDFNRSGALRNYDEKGLNVSAAYHTLPPFAPIAMTIYVYPAGHYLFGAATGARVPFEDAKNELVRARAGVKILGEGQVPAPGGAKEPPGYFGRFAFSEMFAGRVQPLESLLYVYCPVQGAWIVKYRVTYPDDSLEARGAIARFMQELKWTITLPGTPSTTAVSAGSL